MSRIRTIKPELLDDDKAAELPHQAWRLMVSVFVLADDHGRIRASIRYLAANVFSGDREGVEEARERLCRDRFWILYQVNGEEYALIRTFRLHQRIDNAASPRLPDPLDADEPVDLSDVPTDDEIESFRGGQRRQAVTPRNAAKTPAKAKSAAPRRESPRNAAGSGSGSLPRSPTKDPEREERARPDAIPAVEPDAVGRTSPEAPRCPSGAPSVAEVEREAVDAPQPRGEASGAKVAPPPPVLVALVEPEPEDDPAGERASGPISDDAFGAAEVVELYNAHRPAWLPAFDPDAEGDPVAKRRALDDVVDVIRSERSAFRAATREGAALARPGLHTVEGWLAFCARLAAAPPIASFTPVPSLPAWVGGKSGERMRGKLWSGAYDDKHAPRETAMQRNVREAMERAVEARAEEPSWVGLLGAGGSAGR